MRRKIESAVTLLPHPLSPTTADGGGRGDVEGHAVDRAQYALVGAEAGHQVADAEQHALHG